MTDHVLTGASGNDIVSDTYTCSCGWEPSYGCDGVDEVIAEWKIHALANPIPSGRRVFCETCKDFRHVVATHENPVFRCWTCGETPRENVFPYRLNPE